MMVAARRASLSSDNSCYRCDPPPLPERVLDKSRHTRDAATSPLEKKILDPAMQFGSRDFHIGSPA